MNDYRYDSDHRFQQQQHDNALQYEYPELERSSRLLITFSNILAAVGTAVVMGTLLAQIYTYAFPRPLSTATLETRIASLTDQLNTSARVIREIESEIEKRQELASQLQRDADLAQQYSSLKKEHVEAIAQLLRGELKKHDDASWWNRNWTNVAYALLGALLSESFRIIRNRFSRTARR